MIIFKQGASHSSHSRTLSGSRQVYDSPTYEFISAHKTKDNQVKGSECTKAIHQLNKMLENVKNDDTVYNLPGICYTAPQSSINDSNLYKGVLLRLAVNRIT